ncbi:hypothetical protein KFK09_014031 [Dendrobium nobile]|uniref:Uncharacterized protein n=1 Tax=Dendrobium nobile TaxID=94219 RepID=A0A8T3B8U3_DENNO|nr:hypothetical protein KFK09_014031 [Dendrobium nobile]
MEEFSFPAIPAEQDKLSNLPSLPFPFTPVCFLPSPSNHKSELLRNYQRSRSFSCLEDLKLRDEISSSEINDEEKMDMLWEDFNEELSQFSSEGKAGGNNGLDFPKASDKLDGKKRNGSRELFCVKAVHHRRPGLVMILKVFKKLLFIQKNRKKRTSSSIYHM